MAANPGGQRTYKWHALSRHIVHKSLMLPLTKPSAPLIGKEKSPLRSRQSPFVSAISEYHLQGSHIAEIKLTNIEHWRTINCTQGKPEKKRAKQRSLDQAQRNC